MGLENFRKIISPKTISALSFFLIFSGCTFFKKQIRETIAPPEIENKFCENAANFFSDQISFVIEGTKNKKFLDKIKKIIQEFFCKDFSRSVDQLFCKKNSGKTLQLVGSEKEFSSPDEAKKATEKIAAEILAIAEKEKSGNFLFQLILEKYYGQPKRCDEIPQWMINLNFLLQKNGARISAAAAKKINLGKLNLFDAASSDLKNIVEKVLEDFLIKIIRENEILQKNKFQKIENKKEKNREKNRKKWLKKQKQKMKK